MKVGDKYYRGNDIVTVGQSGAGNYVAIWPDGFSKAEVGMYICIENLFNYFKFNGWKPYNPESEIKVGDWFQVENKSPVRLCYNSGNLKYPYRTVFVGGHEQYTFATLEDVKRSLIMDGYIKVKQEVQMETRIEVVHETIDRTVKARQLYYKMTQPTNVLMIIQASDDHKFTLLNLQTGCNTITHKTSDEMGVYLAKNGFNLLKGKVTIEQN